MLMSKTLCDLTFVKETAGVLGLLSFYNAPTIAQFILATIFANKTHNDLRTTIDKTIVRLKTEEQVSKMNALYDSAVVPSPEEWSVFTNIFYTLPKESHENLQSSPQVKKITQLFNCNDQGSASKALGNALTTLFTVYLPNWVNYWPKNNLDHDTSDSVHALHSAFPTIDDNLLLSVLTALEPLKT